MFRDSFARQLSFSVLIRPIKHGEREARILIALARGRQAVASGLQYSNSVANILYTVAQSSAVQFSW